ncbi:MAG: DHHA1 domain-containing protein, partial [bacterium]|nr:DHHA1 domain-containing protein [bacterium]
DKLEEKINELIRKNKEAGKKEKDRTSPDDLTGPVKQSALSRNNSKLIVHDFKELDSKTVNTVGDRIRNEIGSGIILLINTSQEEDKFSLLLLVSDDLMKKGLEANNLIQKILKLVNGTGGGRKDRAQGGAKDIRLVPDLKEKSREMLLNLL